jgi:hypothetical protein
MADYNKSTNFTAKDTLPTGNSGKIVKGAEIDTELTAISNAIASKADINSAGLTGTPTAPTASAGTNTTQLATTAFVTAALSAIYPVGSIYVNAAVSTNPSTLLGFGTWEAFGAGRVMVGFNASDSLFDTLEETGGSKDAIVVSHTHTTTVSTQSLTGAITGISESFASGGGTASGVFTKTTGSTVGNTPVQNDSGDGGGFTFDGSHTHTVTNASTGSSGTNANIQPYITVRMWKRTA